MQKLVAARRSALALAAEVLTLAGMVCVAASCAVSVQDPPPASPEPQNGRDVGFSISPTDDLGDTLEPSAIVATLDWFPALVASPATRAMAIARPVGDHQWRVVVPEGSGYLTLWMRGDGVAAPRVLVGGYFDGDPVTWFSDSEEPIVPRGQDSAIRLLVTDSTDQPVVDAAISLTLSDHASPFDERPRVVTGADGHADIAPTERDYLVNISAKGFAPVRLGARQWPIALQGVRQHVRLTRGATTRIEMSEGAKNKLQLLCELEYLDVASGARCRWTLEPSPNGVVEFPIPTGQTASVSVRDRSTVLFEGRVEAGGTLHVSLGR
jgi:hypothetical protein